MKIIAFGASYSSTSINRQLAGYAAYQFENSDIEVLDLNDYTVPLFTVDVEAKIGHPQLVKDFLHKLEEADLLIISMAENNGSYAAAFKNLFDWTSRVKGNLFEGKKMLLMATSPGARGGRSVLDAALDRFPRHGAEIIASFSLPAFNANFSTTEGITDAALQQEFNKVVQQVKEHYV